MKGGMGMLSKTFYEFCGIDVLTRWNGVSKESNRETF